MTTIWELVLLTRESSNGETYVWKKQIGRMKCLIDELGPLEFKKKIGWVSSLRIMQSKNFQTAFVVIHPEFVEIFYNSGFKYELQHISDLNVIV